MANPYDDVVASMKTDRQGAAPGGANPYDGVLDDIQIEQQKRTRYVFEKALSVNPDAAAEAKKLANQTGLAPDVVARNLDEVRRKEQARMLDLARMAEASPVLARQLADPEFTKQAHDDIGTLTQIAQFFKDTGNSMKAGVLNANKGAAGVLRAGTELIAPILDPLESVTSIGGNPLRRLSEGFAANAAQSDAAAKAVAPKTQGNISSGFQSGVQSLTQNLLALPLAFMPGGQTAALSMMTASTGGQSYQDARAKGLSMAQSLPYAASQATVEYVTEKLPLGQLIGDIKKTTPIIKTLTKQMGLEIPGEQVATILQDLNDWAVLNPEKSFRSYIEERPDAAVQTLVATIVGTGGNVAVSKGIETATRKLMGDAYDAGTSEQAAEMLKQQLATATQSKLRERNPEEFRNLMQRMAEGTEGAPAEVFIDAEVLNQLAPEILQQLPQNVRDQLPDALAANDVVGIPVGDVLTIAPGTELEQMLVDNARVGDPRAMTRTEAQQAGDQAQQYLATEAQRVIEQANDQQAMQDSADRVKQSLLDQLNTAGRFRNDVNEAYATWTTAFYTTMAGRLGLNPEEMAARYPLKIAAQSEQAGAQLEQAAFHGSPYKFDKFSLDHLGKGEGAQAYGWGLYFAGNREVAEWYRGNLSYRDVVNKFRDAMPDDADTSEALEWANSENAPADMARVINALANDDWFGFDYPSQALTALFKEVENFDASPETKAAASAMQGQLYEVNIPEDSTMLLWDKPLSEQPEAVRKALSLPESDGLEVFESEKGFGVRNSKTGEVVADNFANRSSAEKIANTHSEAWMNQTGQQYYKNLIDLDGSDEAASKFLNSLGISGIKYLDGTSRADGDGSFNYVVFDDNAVSIMNTYYQTANQTKARATFNPATLELVLNANANLSSYLHETGHFFLEVMADLANQPNAPAEIADDMNTLLAWFGVTGDENVGGPDTGGSSELGQKVDRNAALSAWFGEESNLRNPDGSPMVLYHGTTKAAEKAIRKGGEFKRSKTGAMGSAIYLGDSTEASAGYNDGAMMTVYARGRYMGNTKWTEYVNKHGWAGAENAARADGWAGVYDVKFESAIAVWDSSSIKATDASEFSETGGILTQDGEAATDQPFAPKRTPLETWNAMTLDQKRKYHERFAESMEQYLLEGKAPSVELQPLFRKFRAWMLNVYKSLKQFVSMHPESGIVLSDEIRQVFDRMVASAEQIAQAEESAGLLPDENATDDAIEKLTARSLRDLKWTVNARAKEIKKLQKQAAEMRKGVEAEVRAEVEAMPVYAAQLSMRGENKLDIGALAEMYAGEGDRYALLDWKPLVDRKLAGKTGVHPDILADSFGYASGDEMVRAVLAAEPMKSIIQGMTDQRMLERHGDLIDDRAIAEAANEAVHNEARARSLATELKSQADMLNRREDTGTENAAGNRVTVNVIAEAAKQFAANVIARTPLRDLKSRATQHVAAERRAGKRWQEATAAGKTQDAVKAKQDQVLNNAAAKAALEAQQEAKKIIEFFRRVVKDGNEKTVERGRDPDVVNAARAVLAAYGVAPRAGKSALEYMEIVQRNDPAMYAALNPSIQGALNSAQPLDALTMEELRGLNEEIQAMWHLAKRSRQMEVDGNLMDIEDAEDELKARMQEVGVPDTVPGQSGALTKREEAARKLQFAGSLLRRVESWAEAMDGKFGGPFLRLVFQPVKEAADRYRADRVTYRKAYQELIDKVAPYLKKGVIEAPELGYTFGRGHNGIGHAELLHAILHTGNDSNKRKLLLGREWATENPDGTLDTRRWDAFIERMQSAGTLTKEHYDFAQGVWDLLEQTKPLAQKTHRDVFGRYFAEVTANEVTTPFGTYRGGYVPAQADPRIVLDADMRKLAEAENENMAFSFPTTNKGFTQSRVDYNRPLMLDLRSIGQHLDKVLLFAHMEPAARDVQKLLTRKGVSYQLGRIDPTIFAGMLTPWLNRSARQTVETPVVGDGGLNRILSVARNRAGMALMFANVSNTLQQLTGFSLAAVKVKPSHMMRATAQMISSPRKTSKAVSEASAFMANRMENEISAINDAMDQIMLDPSLYEKSQAWAQKHAYFLQTAMAASMEPIIWTGAYNQALFEKMNEKDAVRFADNVIRTTQGSTLPEDVSRMETGPSYARAFTQFVGYFNMMANTNATALQQLAREVGLRKGAGKALGIVTLGFLAPIWVAEIIALAMRGGPKDEDDDGYLDDWLAAVFGIGTIKGTLAMVPFVGQLGNAAISRFNNNPADDRMSLSPAVSLLEATVGVPSDIYKAITDPDKLNARNAVRDVASAASIVTGLPAYAIARPAGYLAGVEDDRINPTGPVDMARGIVTGTPSPQSK